MVRLLLWDSCREAIAVRSVRRLGFRRAATSDGPRLARAPHRPRVRGGFAGTVSLPHRRALSSVPRAVALPRRQPVGMVASRESDAVPGGRGLAELAGEPGNRTFEVATQDVRCQIDHTIGSLIRLEVIPLPGFGAGSHSKCESVCNPLSGIPFVLDESQSGQNVGQIQCA